MNFVELKLKAKNQLEPFSKIPRLALLIILLVSYSLAITYSILINRYANTFSANSYLLPQLLYTVIVALINPVFSMAYFALIVQISKQSEAEQTHKFTLKDYFANFRLFKKGIGNYWWTLLWQCLWGMLFFIPILIVMSFFFYFLASKNLIANKTIHTFLTIIAWICIMTVFIVKELSYCFNTYAIADNNDLKIREAMNVSKAITKEHRAEVFKFYMSFIDKYFLIIITLGIASIWLQPHINMSVYNFYKELLEKYNSNAE